MDFYFSTEKENEKTEFLFEKAYKIGEEIPDWLEKRINEGKAFSTRGENGSVIGVTVVTSSRGIPGYFYRGDYVLLSEGDLVPCHEIMFGILKESGSIEEVYS